MSDNFFYKRTLRVNYKNNKSWHNIRYGSAAFVLGIPAIPLLVMLPPLYADTLGLGLTSTGIALFLARSFDVLSDPVIGYISDNLNTRWGCKKPLIGLGTILGGTGLFYLLTPDENISIWYLGLWAIVLYFGWPLINIPYLAWGASLSEDYHGRIKITSIREIFTILGIIAAVAIAAIAASLGYSERGALELVAFLVLGLGCFLFVILLFTVDDPTRKNSIPSRKQNIPCLIYSITTNKPFLLLIFGWFINSLANGIPAVLFILFMKFTLEASIAERGILTFIYFFSGVIGIPIWLLLSHFIGKHRTWCFAMFLACIAFIGVPSLGPHDIFAFSFICIITGLALGADLSLPPAIQADVIEFELFRSGTDCGGTMFSIWSLTTKLALALSVAVAFPALESLGFSPDFPKEENNLFALTIIYAAVPVGLKLLAIALIWHYPLTPKKQNVIRRFLERRQMKGKITSCESALN